MFFSPWKTKKNGTISVLRLWASTASTISEVRLVVGCTGHRLGGLFFSWDVNIAFNEFNGILIVFSSDFMGYYWDKWMFNGIYYDFCPLVNVYIAIENHNFYYLNQRTKF